MSRRFVIGAASVVTALAATGFVLAGAASSGASPGGKPGAPAASPDLKVSVSPAQGPAGTSVQIDATGCVDANGLNHAVSFNSNGRAASAMNNPQAIHTIDAGLNGTTLSAQYTIPPQAAAGAGDAVGTFYVQCGSSVQEADFTVTGP